MSVVRPENVVADIGKQLAQQTRPTKDFLVKSLRQAASALSELEQLSSLKPSISPLSQSLLKHGLLRHKDKDIKLLVAICFCEIIRVLAPDPSFNDKVFKGIFELFIDMFMELADTSSPYFSRRVKILETVATLECCRQMLDLGCDDLILKMFKTFFSVVREEHQRSLISGMLSIMSLILNEEETPQPLLEVILRNLRNKGKGPAPAYHLAVAVVQTRAEKIKPALCGFLTSCILDRESVRSELKECYHEIMFEIFQCAPHMLLAVIPNLAQELLADQVDIRIKSVNFIGKLLTLPKDHDVQEHRYLFVELLKRFSDKSAEVRISVIRAVKSCYMANPSGMESHKILASLEGRLLDFDASVRMETVGVTCDLAKFCLKNFPEALITRAIERLRDKMTSVRKEALRKLLEVYREYCTKCYEGQMMLNESYEQIPCKILVLSFDKNLKEFRPQNLELLLANDLFPASLSVEHRTRHWIYLYSLFSPAHVKALNLVLCQKRRFQTEMQGYLSLRRKEKGNDPEEVLARIKNAFARMSTAFMNPIKAEESFYKLNQLKDNGIFDLLLQVLSEPAFSRAKAVRDKFFRSFGDENSHSEFLEALSLKCSNNIFSSEHVCHILDYVSSSSCRDNNLGESSLNLLSDIITSFPSLLRGSEHQLKMLILEEDSPFCAKLVQILAIVGPFISMQLSEIYPMLERLCLEGTRDQSKAATSAIAALVGPSEQILFVDLSQKLVEFLRHGWNIPTVLQSLGCISQHSVAALEKQGNEVSSYIMDRIFQENITEAGLLDEKFGCNESSICKRKIYGLKTLVKSVLSKKEAHGEERISSLLDILSKVLLTGEFADAATACEKDVAHIRLAAANSVLRLSRRWDLHISPQIFQATVMIAKDASYLLRKAFIDKTHKLLKEHTIPSKYACVFALAASDCVKDLQDVALKYLVEFIKQYSRASRSYATLDTEASLTDCPAYLVVFLVHVLAHDAGFPTVNSHSEELLAEFCRPLVLLLYVLVNSKFVDGDLDLVNKTFLYLRSLFRAIKRAEDAVDPDKTAKLHKLADIGMSILDVLKHDGINLSLAPGLVLLPSLLYKTSLIKKSKEDNCCPTGFVSYENFVRKLIHIFECDFSQLSIATVKRSRKCQKESLQDQNIVDLSVYKQVGLLRNVTLPEKVAVVEMARTPVLEAHLKGRQQSEITSTSLGRVQLQDDSSVIEELEADGPGNFENVRTIEHHIESKSANIELFGTESDVSTQEADASLSVSEQDDRKKKRSCGSAGSPDFSKSKGSTVSFLRQCDPENQRLGGNVKETITGSRGGAAEKKGTGGSKRKILLDRINSLAVNGLQKHCQQKKSCLRHEVSPDTSVSDVSDAIAFRTRRRKA